MFDQESKIVCERSARHSTFFLGAAAFLALGAAFMAGAVLVGVAALAGRGVNTHTHKHTHGEKKRRYHGTVEDSRERPSTQTRKHQLGEHRE